MKIIIVFIGLLLCSCYAQAQSARPYFQQEVNYTISVRLDDTDHTLHGNESFEYINNSPDDLAFIYIHLWPNAYKDKTTALAHELAGNGNFILHIADDADIGFIDSLDFKADGKGVKWEFDSGNIDICKLTFDTPLQPGARTVISTPFRVKLPNGSISRMGHIGQSYQVTQWYPKPAVYDREGWHPIPYLTQGEFYSEFGSYDVSITLPANYVVGATGDVQNESEKLFLDSLAALGTERPDLPADNTFPESSSRLKTNRYVQHKVHDFGWFADKRWMVLKGEVETPHINNRVTTWSMFTPGNAELWQKAPEYIHDAVYYYSLWNGDYPYRQVTAVDGTISAGGGMEYPNVTIIGYSGNARSLETVIMHEVGHNWFYGMLGSNERDHAWMDEGINSFNEDRYLETKYPDATLTDAVGIDLPVLNKILRDFPQKTISYLSYLISARYSADQPLNYTSADYSGMNYGGIVYKKSALIFQYLRAYLGNETFDRCAHAYFNEWKFKHPSPADIREVYERTSGRDLSWFFDQLINTTDKVDFRIASVAKRDDGIYATIRNKGKVEGPFSVSLLQGENILLTKWSEPLAKGEKVVVKLPNISSRDKVRIDAGNHIPEINRANNTQRINGILRKVEPLDLQFFTFLEKPARTQLFYIPLVAWNQYNHFMGGVNFHNRLIPQKQLEWSVAPLYSFGENNLNGFASIVYRNNGWQGGLKGQKFNSEELNDDMYTIKSGYALAQPFVTYSVNRSLKSSGRSFRATIDLSYQYVYLFTKLAWHMQDNNDVSHYKRDRENVILQVNLSQNTGLRSKFSGKFRLNYNTDFVSTGNVRNSDEVGNLLSADLRYDWRYSRKQKRYLTVRGFLGYTLNDDHRRYVWSVAGQTGQYDFFYNQLYLGRTETDGLLSRQVSNGQGMLLTPTTASATKNISALNITFRLPFALPLAVYGGIANTYSPFFYDVTAQSNTYWSAGLSLPLIRDAFEIYIPVVNSANINAEFKTRDINFAQTIMFQLNIKMANPFEIFRNIEQ